MKLDHVAIWAVDIELMRTFYEKYFDARSNLTYENERKRFTSKMRWRAESANGPEGASTAPSAVFATGRARTPPAA
jgi:catechol 2,3-dioxygenase-like lactoylglutathione lyase family enzyme